MAMFGRSKRDKTSAKFILVGTDAQAVADPEALARIHVRGHSMTPEHKAFLVRAAAAEHPHVNRVLASRSRTGTQQHKAFLASTLAAQHPHMNSMLADAVKSGSFEKAKPLPEISFGAEAGPREGGPEWK